MVEHSTGQPLASQSLLDVAPVGQNLRAAVSSTLAQAFFDDPAIRWMLPNDQRRIATLPKMFDWQFDVHQQQGFVAASPDAEVAALWLSPGKVHFDDAPTLAFLARMIRLFGRSLPRSKKVGDAIHAHIPGGENWLYLRYLGVRPDAQGQGWGGRAIRSGIAHADSLGVGTCLETSNPANVGLYMRFGFRTIAEWDVGKDGPHFWTMVRDLG